MHTSIHRKKNFSGIAIFFDILLAIKFIHSLFAIYAIASSLNSNIISCECLFTFPSHIHFHIYFFAYSYMNAHSDHKMLVVAVHSNMESNWGVI